MPLMGGYRGARAGGIGTNMVCSVPLFQVKLKTAKRAVQVTMAMVAQLMKNTGSNRQFGKKLIHDVCTVPLF